MGGLWLAGDFFLVLLNVSSKSDGAFLIPFSFSGSYGSVFALRPVASVEHAESELSFIENIAGAVMLDAFPVQ